MSSSPVNNNLNPAAPQQQQRRPIRNPQNPSSRPSSPQPHMNNSIPISNPTMQSKSRSSSPLRGASSESCGSRTIEDFVATLLQLINSAGSSAKVGSASASGTVSGRNGGASTTSRGEYVRTASASAMAGGVPGNLSPSVEEVPDEEGGSVNGGASSSTVGVEWKYTPVTVVSAPDDEEGGSSVDVDKGKEAQSDRLNIPSVSRKKDSKESAEKAFHRQKLAMNALNRINDHLWLFGTIETKLLTVNPLTHYRALGLSIISTEDSEKHLVRNSKLNEIYIKPLPSFLVNTDFWSVFDDNERNYRQTLSNSRLTRKEVKDLGKLAYGFLKSYSRLVCSEEDYEIAVQLNLLPNPEFGFIAWERILKDPTISSNQQSSPNIPRRPLLSTLKSISTDFEIPTMADIELPSAETIQNYINQATVMGYEILKKYPEVVENWRLLLYLFWLIFGQEIALRVGMGWFEKPPWTGAGFGSILAFFPMCFFITILLPIAVVYVSGSWEGWWEGMTEAVENCSRAFGIGVDDDFWVDA